MQNNELVGDILITICPILMLALIFFTEEKKRKRWLKVAIFIQLFFIAITIESVIKPLNYSSNNPIATILILTRLAILMGYLFSLSIIFVKIYLAEKKIFKPFFKKVTLLFSIVSIIVTSLLIIINTEIYEQKKYIYVEDNKEFIRGVKAGFKWSNEINNTIKNKSTKE